MPLHVCNGSGCSRISTERLCPPCKVKANQRQYNRRKARGRRTGSTYEYRKNRASALARAGNRCENPGCSATLTLECHHRNGNPKDHRLENLIILCHECHRQTF